MNLILRLIINIRRKIDEADGIDRPFFATINNDVVENVSPEDKATYDAREKAIRDQQRSLNSSRKEGIIEGKIEGETKGEIKTIRVL